MTKADKNGIDQKVEQVRLDSLYQRSLIASVGLGVAYGIYSIILTIQFDWKYLFAWFASVLLILLVRWRMYHAYKRAQGNGKSLAQWLSLFRLGIFAAGLSVGCYNFFFFPHGSFPILLIAIVLPLGVALSAVQMLVDFFSFVIYTTTLFLPLIYQIMFGESLHPGTAVLIIVMAVYLLRFSREYEKIFISNSRLMFENKELLENLEEEKNTINNRLGRILNDSTTNIYVADAETLRCLQVNQGAVDSLGYSREEFEQVSLLDIFSDFNKDSFQQLLLPMHNGNWRPVVHKGTNKRKDGSEFPVEASIQLSTEDDPQIIVVNVQDITDRVKWEEKLIYQANYDQLTGLYNRHYIQSYMNLAFHRAERYRKKVALLYLDIDHFKDVNDSLGHDTGDLVLKECASRISTLLRDSDTAARTGGDEFTVFIENLEESQHAGMVAGRIVKLLQKPFHFKGHEIYATVSVGVSIFPDDGFTSDEIMQCADMAMYQAKKDGRNMYRYFSMEMRHISEQQVQISSHLRYAIGKNELSLVYQPKIDANNNRIVGAEALLRWKNCELGDIPPDVFIPLAENLGIIQEFGDWVLEKACKEAKMWEEISNRKLTVSVNVSPQQFRTESILKSVDLAIAKSGFAFEQLELEITETLLLQDSDIPLSILNKLHERGIILALDDFGTGYSSLNYLRRFPLQVLKIDRSFIKDLDYEDSHKVLVDTIIAMAHSLKLEVVAEGVETKNQLDYLRARDVDIIQGYYYSPPIPADKFRSLLTI
ncbi:MAG: EAL domain-containing protein [Desulfofustis sp.]|nr:EAL domain-containing protein [Desulfofustis sp.]